MRLAALAVVVLLAAPADAAEPLDYTLWRDAQILYATRLEFRCLDPRRGIYSLIFDDPFRQRLFQKALGKRLLPALEATFQVLR